MIKIFFHFSTLYGNVKNGVQRKIKFLVLLIFFLFILLATIKYFDI